MVAVFAIYLGRRTTPSRAADAKGLARLRWDSVDGDDAYIILRDGKGSPAHCGSKERRKNGSTRRCHEPLVQTQNDL